MPSLKEIKTRIASVSSTLKITQAMKLVASSKLRKVQSRMTGFEQYSRHLSAVLDTLLRTEGVPRTPLAEQHPDSKTVTLVAFGSNSSLCGSYNSNVCRLLKKSVAEAESNGLKVKVYALGEKIYKFALREGYDVDARYRHWGDGTTYDQMGSLAFSLMEDYCGMKTDSVHLLYTRFISNGTQICTDEECMPLTVSAPASSDGAADTVAADLILEPSASEIAADLIPYDMCARFYRIFLSSSASEHACRMIAMQTATDNATELLREISLQYNKQRQAAITAELTDISNAQ
ncbi:MAG: ATP synthase F1 subunit gamma [Bacteroidales bacterium]|nr:ATP synthase F1 subunit gamma [Bacteroidales bacterium]